MNTCGTFGIGSAAYWWSRFGAAVGRWIHYCLGPALGGFLARCPQLANLNLSYNSDFVTAEGIGGLRDGVGDAGLPQLAALNLRVCGIKAEAGPALGVTLRPHLTAVLDLRDEEDSHDQPSWTALHLDLWMAVRAVRASVSRSGNVGVGRPSPMQSNVVPGAWARV